MAKSKKEGVITNPNGANQWKADPRQQLFLAFYLDPKSTTFANALQSGIKAGFTQEYSENIMSKMPEWLSEKIGQSPLLLKAERNIAEFLELPNETQAMGAFGPIYQKEKYKVQAGKYKNGKPKFKTMTKQIPIFALNKGVMKIKADVSMFVAETVGKQKYSKKDTGDNNIQNNIFIFANEQRSKIAARIIRGGSVSDSPSKGKPD